MKAFPFFNYFINAYVRQATEQKIGTSPKSMTGQKASGPHPPPFFSPHHIWPITELHQAWDASPRRSSPFRPMHHSTQDKNTFLKDGTVHDGPLTRLTETCTRHSGVGGGGEIYERTTDLSHKHSLATLTENASHNKGTSWVLSKYLIWYTLTLFGMTCNNYIVYAPCYA